VIKNRIEKEDAESSQEASEETTDENNSQE
jgi:hypothetical protein